VNCAPQTTYLCPGHSQPISRSLHLGRLLAFYPGCSECPHREDVGETAARTQAALAARNARQRAGGPQFGEEDVGGVYLNQLDRSAVLRLGLAFAAQLRDARPAASTPCTVVLGGDGRPLAGELIAAASEGLRRGGLAVVDVGSTCSGALSWAICELNAAGGVLVGNGRSEANHVALKFWAADGTPLSRGDGLDQIERRYAANIDRPTRRFGPLRRSDSTAAYLADLSSRFHALRPLQFVFDSASRPLAKHLATLLSQTACRVISAGRQLPAVAYFPHACVAERAEAEPEKSSEQLAPSLLGSQVVEEGAHFGIWIDGDGQRLALVDERGVRLSTAWLTAMLAAQSLRQHPGGAVVLEVDSPGAVADAIARHGGRIVRSRASCAAMVRTMRENAALLGGGPSGRIWLAEPRIAVDALRVLSLLLVALSTSDRPLAQVVDEVRGGQ